jgi:hypothetical protein
MVPAGYYHDAEGRRRDAGRHPHSTIDAVQPPGTTTGRASLADVLAPGPAAARWLVAAVLAATPFSAGDPGTRRGWEEELARRPPSGQGRVRGRDRQHRPEGVGQAVHARRHRAEARGQGLG